MIFNEPVTVIEPSWVDNRGTLVPNYDAPLSVETVELCSVQPGASSEDLQNRTQVTIRKSVYVNRIVQVSDFAAVEHLGVRLLMFGSAAHWRSPTGRVTNTVLNLIDWEG